MAAWIRMWSVLLVLSSVSIAANAQDTDAEAKNKAKEHYLDGKALFEKGEYEKALESFTESYNLSQEPNLLYNLGITAELSGDVERAIAYLEVYLEELPDTPDAPEVRKHLEDLRENKEEPIPQVAVDLGPQEPAPEPVVEPEPMPEPTPIEEQPEYYSDEKEDEQKGVFWPGVTLGIGGLLLASGTITGIAAYKKYDELEVNCSPTCTSDEVKTSKNLAIATDVLLGLGAAAVVTGVVLWIVDSKKERRTASRNFGATPVALEGGGAMLFEGRF